MIEAVAIFSAGVWAGAINVIVGSGTLVTFPTLLLFGYPPLTANVSNNIGMVAGGISGIYGYRRELRPNRAILVRLAPASIAGALVGAVLLLVLPDESFKAIVPALIALGLLMVVIGLGVQRRVDVGRVVNVDGVRNQIEGGAIQAASWSLLEQVRFDRHSITSTDWESYPIARFSQVPAVDVHLVHRPDEPPLGAGEATQGPATAAIGNALADALGVRVRTLPFTPDNIVAAINAAP